MVCNGDNITKIDLTEAIKFHKSHNGLATVILFGVPKKDISRFGIADFDKKTGRIIEFVYKPVLERAPSNLAHAGYVIMEPEVMDYIPYGKTRLECIALKEIARKKLLYGYIVDTPYWLDIGTMESYLQANKIILEEAGIIAPPIGNEKR